MITLQAVIEVIAACIVIPVSIMAARDAWNTPTPIDEDTDDNGDL